MQGFSFGSLAKIDKALQVLCLGAHCDDIEIGAGGTLLQIAETVPNAAFTWVTFCSNEVRRKETEESARALLGERVTTHFHAFRDGFLPYSGSDVKDAFEELKKLPVPDVIFTHTKADLHQDHRQVCELTWNTFRNHFILEYEIPKYDGDLSVPQIYVPLTEKQQSRKESVLMDVYGTQRNKQWFDKETIRGLARLRGIECAADGKYAEGFYCRKLVLK